MSTTYANGQAAAAPPPSVKAQLAINVPFRAKLKFREGLLCSAANSRFPEAGDQIMFTLADERKLYVPVHVSEKMTQLGGQDFIITKKQALASRKVTWVVNRADHFDTSVHAAVDAVSPAHPAPPPAPPVDSAVPPAWDDGDYTSWGEPPPEDVAPAPPVAPVAPPPPAPRQPVSRMGAALIAAIDATIEATDYARTRGITLKFSEEDYRAIAATLFIQQQKEGR
jgi:hypothetical protein